MVESDVRHAAWVLNSWGFSAKPPCAFVSLFAMRSIRSQSRKLLGDASRVAVIGTTGSGKTMLAKELSLRLGVLYVELDALNWGPEWTPAQPDVLRERAQRALGGDSWVADGNYGALRDIIWRRADTIVWLDYPLRVVFTRLFWRTVRRSVTKEKLWNGNRERFWVQFFHRDSLFLWALRTYWGERRQYPALLRQPEYEHLRLVHLRSPRDARRLLAARDDAD